MPPAPPNPEQLARQLLTLVTAEPPTFDGWLTAAEHMHDRLRGGLMVFLGQRGFDSLWERAMYLAQRTPAWGTSEEQAPAAQPPALATVVQGQDATEAYTSLVGVFASFFTLLWTFVGTELGFRLVHQIWPELPLDHADTHTGDTTR